jgi:hypothetical protein
MKKILQQYLILIDLDGTSLNKGGTELNPITLKYLKILKDQGHIICVATGRPFRSSQKFYHQLHLNTLICNFNGSYIHHPTDKKFKSLTFPINASIVKQILNEEVFFDKVTNKLLVENLLIENHHQAQYAKPIVKFDTYFDTSDEEEKKYDASILKLNPDFSQ